MMKFKTASSIDSKAQAIKNMTWDLYLMNNFLERWQNKNDNDEYIFASDDKAFSSLLRTTIDIQTASSLKPLKSLLNETDYISASKTLTPDKHSEKRIYQSTEWTPEYRSRLISFYENKIFTSPL